MKSISELLDRFTKSPGDCTGIDIGTTVTKAVRLKKTGDDITVIGAALIPSSTEGSIPLPPQVRARQASIAMSGKNAVVKLLNFPGHVDKEFEKSLPQKLGISDATEYRMAYRVIHEGSSRTDSTVLAAAIPEEEAATVMKRFATGLPAPYSLELTSLATLNAFEHGPVSSGEQETASLIDFGSDTTSFAVFHRKQLALIQYFDFGTSVVVDALKTELKVDALTARGILDDNSFDLSDILSNQMGSVASHLVISRDFVERQKNCNIDTVYAIGGIANSQAAMRNLSKMMSVKIVPWDPFDSLNLPPDVLSDEINSQRGRFAGAIGAALATLEEE